MGFFKELIHRLISEGNTVNIATNETDSKVPECYREWGCRVYPIECTRSVVCKGNFNAIRELREVVSKNTYDIVHCHTPIAAACVRVACRRLRKNGMKVVYTAHGFHFFKGAPLKNWLFYYPVEKLLSYWTDCLITINREDYKRAKKKFHAKRTEYVPGVGIDLEKFSSGFVDINEKRKSLGISENDIMLLSVGELSERKNHEAVIRALAGIDNAEIKYFVAGQGGLQGHLSALIKEYGMEDNITLLGYRTDISELCQAADLFVFPSKQEGLPVAMMEAIACGTPVICSRIRGNVELIQNEMAMFDPDDVKELTACLRWYIGEKKRSEFKEGWEKEATANYKHLLMYDIRNVCSDMNRLYCYISGGGYDRLSVLLKRRDFADELNINVGNTIILSVGELNRNKNHSTIIQAVAELGDSSVHYVVAGQGELKEELEKLAEGLGIAAQVHLLGFRDDIADIMKVVDLYCLPSLREGLNVSLMEAMASGLPCLAGDIRGNSDILGKEGRKNLLPLGEAKLWAESIQNIRNRMGCFEKTETAVKNHKRMEQYSEGEVFDQMKNIYKTIK